MRWKCIPVVGDGGGDVSETREPGEVSIMVHYSAVNLDTLLHHPDMVETLAGIPAFPESDLDSY